MRIAFCDDNAEELKLFESMLSEYKNGPISIRCYQNGTDLINAVHNGTHFDVIFLDIIMPGTSGINIAKELRDYDQRVEIVFLTISPDFALESYSVRARHYIIKPPMPHTLFALLDDIRSTMQRESREVLVINTKSGLRKLVVSHLEFCEIIRRTLHYHMTNGAVYEENGNLGELENRLLHFDGFIKPHRSYIVNMDYIAHIDSSRSTIQLESMKEIPIPRVRCSEIRETVHEWLARKGEKV